MKRSRIWLLAASLLLSLSPMHADDSPRTAPRDTRDPQRLLALGRANDAIGNLQQRISVNGKDAEAWNLLSRAYLSEEQWDKAVESGEKAVALEPQSSEFHSWLGRAYGEKADHISHVNFIAAIRLARKTRGEFEKAVELAPQRVAALSDLGEFMLEAPGLVGGGIDKAVQVQQKLATLDPPTGHWLQARIDEKTNRIGEAERAYHAAIESSGDHKGQYWLNLASFLRRRNRLDEMEAAIQQAVTGNEHGSGVLMEAAELLVRADRNFNTAGKLLRQYLEAAQPVESDPAFQAHYLLGSIFEKQGDRNSAASEYRSALQLASAYVPAQEALKRVTP